MTHPVSFRQIIAHSSALRNQPCPAILPNCRNKFYRPSPSPRDKSVLLMSRRVAGSSQLRGKLNSEGDKGYIICSGRGCRRRHVAVCRSSLLIAAAKLGRPCRHALAPPVLIGAKISERDVPAGPWSCRCSARVLGTRSTGSAFGMVWPVHPYSWLLGLGGWTSRNVCLSDPEIRSRNASQEAKRVQSLA